MEGTGKLPRADRTSAQHEIVRGQYECCSGCASSSRIFHEGRKSSQGKENSKCRENNSTAGVKDKTATQALERSVVESLPEV